MTRIAILASGRGSNANALLNAMRDGSVPATAVGVLSDQEKAGVLDIAAHHGVPAIAEPKAKGMSRADHEERIGAVLRDWQVDLICLAGYMRVLSPAFTARWHGRMLNIHPSLLPAFPGLDTHERALERGVTLHGCTVHLVTEGVDEGAILAQAMVEVRHDDTSDSLAERVLGLEHRLYPLALRDWIEGRTRLGSRGRIERSAMATGLIT